MGPLLRLSNASFGYGREPVLSRVDLEIAPGAFWGIAGPNGAGKTTLFRGMLGLIRPLEGSVERASAPIGYVPQRESLDPLFPLRVEEVVEMGAYHRLSRARKLALGDRDRVGHALEQVELADLRRRLFSSLSGGQRQRALIARALLVQPSLLLLDEPTSGVDRATRRVILELLVELNRDSGLAILLVTHDLVLLRQFAHKLVWVEDGLARLGEVDDVLRTMHEARGA